MKPAGFVIIGLVLLGCGTAVAGEVHKCVDKDGNVTFSDTICPEAAPSLVELPAPADPAAPTAQGTGASSGAAASAPRGGYGDFIDRGRDAQQDSRTPVPAPDAGG